MKFYARCREPPTESSRPGSARSDRANRLNSAAVRLDEADLGQHLPVHQHHYPCATARREFMQVAPWPAAPCAWAKCRNWPKFSGKKQARLAAGSFSFFSVRRRASAQEAGSDHHYDVGGRPKLPSTGVSTMAPWASVACSAVAAAMTGHGLHRSIGGYTNSLFSIEA